MGVFKQQKWCITYIDIQAWCLLYINMSRTCEKSFSNLFFSSVYSRFISDQYAAKDDAEMFYGVFVI